MTDATGKGIPMVGNLVRQMRAALCGHPMARIGLKLRLGWTIPRCDATVVAKLRSKACSWELSLQAQRTTERAA
jgi:hypothetical protein